MKHLKLFEAFSSKENFDIISHGEYEDMRLGKDMGSAAVNSYIEYIWRPFTEDESNKLNSLFRIKPTDKAKSRWEHDSINDKIRTCERQYNDNTPDILGDEEILITKLRDDWFIIKRHGNVNFNKIDGPEDLKQYKCDGWVGLLKCLKYLRTKCSLLK